MGHQLHRRLFLAGLGASGLAGRSGPSQARSLAQATDLSPLRAEVGRISRITVCTRPFRAAGPRIEVEMVGDKRVVHNYGHGGAGWSLSWGSAALARDLALQGGPRACAVVGCGVLGLTAAIQILRSGCPTTIYAAEPAPFTRSVRATGVWSPDSRLAASDAVSGDFGSRWEGMARQSWYQHMNFVGLAGEPVSVMDQYSLFALQGRGRAVGPVPSPGRVPFVRYQDRLAGLGSVSRPLARSDHRFPVSAARVAPRLTFNVSEYAQQLLNLFHGEGGRLAIRRFNHPSEFGDLSEPVVVNCTGYGARALFGDISLVPIRGQITWLVAQPEVTYSLNYNAVTMIPRPMGIIVQAQGASSMVGYGLDDETPDWSEAESAVAELATLFV